MGASALRSPRLMKARIVDAMWEVATPRDRPGREDGEFHLAEPGGMWDFHYSGDCASPCLVNRISRWGPEDPRPDGRGFYETTLKVRCRKCEPCLKWRTRMWVARAADECKSAMAQGLRTWFGTLTFRPDVHDLHEQLAFEEWAQDHPAAAPSKCEWDALSPEERWPFLRDQALSEVQRYWKRLRKAGHRFRYFAVFEPHLSGRVHVHWLLHETERRILYKHLEGAWGLGHAVVVIVGGRSKRSGPPRSAAFYVAKYLSKTYQARQLASRRYGRAKPASP